MPVQNMKDSLHPRGRVEIFTTKGAPRLILGDIISTRGGLKVYSSVDIDFSKITLLERETVENIIVDQGKDKIIQALTSGSINQIGRMAVGDRGTLPSDPTTPKVPESTFTTLYNEVYRADIEATSWEIGTHDRHAVKFVKTSNTIHIPISAFSNQSKPVINEVGLVTYDAGLGPLPRTAVISPGTPPADERLFSIRTFKSVPFEAANEISVTIRYTIYIE